MIAERGYRDASPAPVAQGVGPTRQGLSDPEPVGMPGAFRGFLRLPGEPAA
ncbi:hypothetical protein ACF1BE_02200 [Streptomyces sp. NPDC014991]|uniref:hypothetical protein n=1 Tax=Streptomyces sp. NPDC014991 TaxID=3364935 RepID=UPI0036F628D6